MHLKPTSWTITIISKLFWYDPENNLVATPKLFWIHCVNIRQKLWIWQVVFISVVYETKWWWAKLIEGFCDPAKKLEIQGPNSFGYILCKNYLECMPTSTWYYLVTFNRISKGQIISEWLLDVFIWTKKRTKIFLYFCPSLWIGSNHKNKDITISNHLSST